ncbi:MAG: cyclic nucleotide-binding domain-containing protein [Deltaproteobacteria bacterium]|nr:cyclic nucleotide-binding domain-containing protein [Deltaproteobacteria bacterium]
MKGVKGEASHYTNTMMDILITIPIFDSLDPHELSLTVKYTNLVKVKQGEVIFQEGDRGDYVCFVVDGKLEVIKTSEAGHHVPISILGKGRSIGEMSILDNFPRSASIRAKSNAILVTLSRENFNTIVEEYPRIGIKILKGLARILSLSLRKTSSRLADYLLPLG